MTLPTIETMESPEWNRQRQALEKTVLDAVMDLLAHMGFPGGIAFPLTNTYELVIRNTAAKGNQNAQQH